ncbi:MAG TPA: hypothetical protein VFZ00_03150 [Solirubrobacter sp.]|nr:hypothetical protein [Solirubrobacter sp.]
MALWHAPADGPVLDGSVVLAPVAGQEVWAAGVTYSASRTAHNPLCLPQAKIYRGSCALGPCLVPVDEAPPAEEMEISLTIARGGEDVFTGSTRSRCSSAGWTSSCRGSIPP